MGRQKRSLVTAGANIYYALWFLRSWQRLSFHGEFPSVKPVITMTYLFNTGRKQQQQHKHGFSVEIHFL